MSESETKAQASGFQRVTRSFDVVGGARRDPAGVEVATTGLSESNVEGGRLIINLFREAGVTPEQGILEYGADKLKGLIALYVGRKGATGAMPVRITDGKVSFHLGGAFEEYPSLRPATTVQCSLSLPGPDSTEREPHLVLNVKDGLAKRKGTTTATNTKTTDANA